MGWSGMNFEMTRGVSSMPWEAASDIPKDEHSHRSSYGTSHEIAVLRRLVWDGCPTGSYGISFGTTYEMSYGISYATPHGTCHERSSKH